MKSDKKQQLIRENAENIPCIHAGMFSHEYSKDYK